MCEQGIKRTIRAVDLFAGVGGSSCGARLASVEVVAAIDRWSLAKKNYLLNFPNVEYFTHKCETFDIARITRMTRLPIDLLLSSPECTNHTCAKGSAERSEDSRRTAYQVIRFAKALRPRWIVVENVIQMRNWRRYDEWCAELVRLGYNLRKQILNASHFGVPQTRKRLFIFGDRMHVPPEISPLEESISYPVASFLDRNGTYQFTPLFVPNRAKGTLDRARRAIEAVGLGSPFLLVYYGTDGAGGWQHIDRPLRTVTTIDRFAYVRVGRAGRHEMRMLQVPEIQAAMGFPSDFRLEYGTRREKIKLLGNAVCPPVMKRIIEELTSSANVP